MEQKNKIYQTLDTENTCCWWDQLIIGLGLFMGSVGSNKHIIAKAG